MTEVAAINAKCSFKKLIFLSILAIVKQFCFNFDAKTQFIKNASIFFVEMVVVTNTVFNFKLDKIIDVIGKDISLNKCKKLYFCVKISKFYILLLSANPKNANNKMICSAILQNPSEFIRAALENFLCFKASPTIRLPLLSD